VRERLAFSLCVGMDVFSQFIRVAGNVQNIIPYLKTPSDAGSKTVKRAHDFTIAAAPTSQRNN